jgi:hypothetical protein
MRKKVCSKPTSSKSSLCKKYASGYYVTQYINRLQDNAKIAEMLKKVKILEDAKLLEDARKLEEEG